MLRTLGWSEYPTVRGRGVEALSLEQQLGRHRANRRRVRDAASSELMRRAHEMQLDPSDAWASVSYTSKWRSLIDPISTVVRTSIFFEIELPGTGGPAIEAVLQPFAEQVEEVLLSAFPGLHVRTFATHQPWRIGPLFHVDQAAFTLIAPLHRAPTLYAPDARYSSASADIPEGLPLGMETRRATPTGQILSSDERAFFLIKGTGWHPDHVPLVHSPPAPLEVLSVPLPEASALIFEMRRD